MVSKTEQVNLLFRLAIASVSCFRREVQLEAGSLFWSWSRAQRQQAAGDPGPLPLSTTQMGWGFGDDGLAQQRGKETPPPTGSRNSLLTPPISFHPAETSCVSHFLSLTPAFPNIWTGQ